MAWTAIAILYILIGVLHAFGVGLRLRRVSSDADFDGDDWFRIIIEGILWPILIWSRP